MEPNEIIKQVLLKIVPRAKERKEMEALAKKLESKVAAVAKTMNVKAKVRIEGSLAKDTWLSHNPDVDVFMRVPSSVPRSALDDTCLKIARKATRGSRQLERFAEHPYLEAFVQGVRVNIVPCYDVKRGEWLSATDRTPFHTDYVNKHLTPELRNEVRLLKKFADGVGAYGAEIKIGGFSGYLCELLILHHRSFLRTIRAFADSEQRMTIDLEGHFENRASELDLLFKEPLVVVDPVDRARNVASAVRPARLETFIAASQVFLRKANSRFFFPPETSVLSIKEFKSRIRENPCIVFVTFGGKRSVPDILWGQLYKSQRSLRKLIELNDFAVLRDVAWSDEAELNMFVFELEQQVISPLKKHLGPPLIKQLESERFIAKHLDARHTFSGPMVENGRWVVHIRRRYIDVVTLLSDSLKDGGKRVGVANGLSSAVRNGLRIFVNDGIEPIYRKNKGFAKFFTEFLSGKPKWLEAEDGKSN